MKKILIALAGIATLAACTPDRRPDPVTNTVINNSYGQDAPSSGKENVKELPTEVSSN